MRPTITQQLSEERIKQLKELAPAREKAFAALSTLKKERIDAKTVILVKE